VQRGAADFFRQVGHIVAVPSLVMTVETSLHRDQAECLAAWVGSPDARAAARHLLEQRRLPRDDSYVDDVLEDTALRVLRRLHNLGPLAPHEDGRDPVVPYARRVLDTAVTDLLRGPARREDLVAEMPESGEPAGEIALAVGELDAVRRRVFVQADGAPPWAVSAVLVVTSLAEEPALRLRSDTPEPETGAEGARWRWAGLFYSGRLDCFPGEGDEDDANRRMRRSRALKALDQLLAQAATEDGT
jgi:hypothetical protein